MTTTTHDDRAELAAEFGYMTAIADRVLEYLGCPEEGLDGDLGDVISNLEVIAVTARQKIAPPIVEALRAAAAAGDDFRDAARVAVSALMGAMQLHDREVTR